MQQQKTFLTGQWMVWNKVRLALAQGRENLFDSVICPGSKGGPITHHIKQQEKNFLQKLKDVFWKPAEAETEAEVQEIDKETQKMS